MTERTTSDRTSAMRPWLRLLARNVSTLAETMEQMTPLLLDITEARPQRHGLAASEAEDEALRAIVVSLQWMADEAQRLAVALQVGAADAPPPSRPRAAVVAPPDRVPERRTHERTRRPAPAPCASTPPAGALR